MSNQQKELKENRITALIALLFSCGVIAYFLILVVGGEERQEATIGAARQATYLAELTPSPTPDLGEALSRAGKLCESSLSSSSGPISGAIPGSILVLFAQEPEGSRDWYPVWEWVPEALAYKDSDISAIVCVRQDVATVGAYYVVQGTPEIFSQSPPVGGIPTGYGYQFTWSVQAFEWPEGRLIAATRLEGDGPPSVIQGQGSAYGSQPNDRFEGWLRNQLPTALLPTLPPGIERILYSGDTVWSVAFSPDGMTIASGSSDGAVMLWDVATGQVLRTLSEHTDVVHDVAFSPDGRMLASGSWDKTVILWDITTGEARQTLAAHADAVSSVAFSPDGNLVASGSWDGSVKLWDVLTGQARQTLRGHTGRVTDVAFSPDGKVIASAGDTTVMLWDMTTGQSLRAFQGNLGTVDFSTAEMRSLAFSPDGKKLAAGADSNIIGEARLTLWDLRTGEGKVLSTTSESDVSSLAFSPDGTILASGSNDWTVILWDVATGQAQRSIRGSYAQVNSVAFSPDGRTLAAGYWDDVVVLWSVGP